MAYTIDTAAAIERLQEAGVDTAAARAIVETVAVADESLATKRDLDALESRLEAAIVERLAAQQRWFVGTVVAATGLLVAPRFWG